MNLMAGLLVGSFIEVVNKDNLKDNGVEVNKNFGVELQVSKIMNTFKVDDGTRQIQRTNVSSWTRYFRNHNQNAKEYFLAYYIL